MPAILKALRKWLARRRHEREALRLLRELFRSPELLSGTSLRPRHARRWIHVGHDVEEGEIARIHFGILRHPRPYRFSSQAHKVIEYWTFDVAASQVQRQRGINITRLHGRDAD